MSNEGVGRTAPATPGMLVIYMNFIYFNMLSTTMTPFFIIKATPHGNIFEYAIATQKLHHSIFQF